MVNEKADSVLFVQFFPKVFNDLSCKQKNFHPHFSTQKGILSFHADVNAKAEVTTLR